MKLTFLHRRFSLVASICFAALLTACGGGGGGGGSAAGSDGDSMSPPDISNPGTQTPDTDTPDIDNPVDQNPDAEGPDTSMPDADDPDTDTDPNNETADPDDMSDPEVDEPPVIDVGENTGDPALPVNLDQALVVVSEDAPAPGTEDETLGRILTLSLDVTDEGGLMFTGRLSVVGEVMLWGGTLSAPQLLLRSGMAIDGFPANIRVESFDSQSIRLSEDGSVAAVTTLDGARAVTAVLRSGNDGMEPVFRSDESIDFDGGSQRFTGFSQVSHLGDTVAVAASEGGRLFSLMLARNGDYQFVAPSQSSFDDDRIFLAPAQAEGCRYMSSGAGTTRQPRFVVREDGSVVFQADVFVESGVVSNIAFCPDRFRQIANTNNTRDRVAGNGFDAIVVYRDGVYTRIVSVGDPVPGMDNVVFKTVFLSQALTDGSMVVAAELNDITTLGRERQSRWLFKEGETPRLLMLDGESVESNVTNQTLTLRIGNGSGFNGINKLEVRPGGSTLIVDELGNSNSSNEDVDAWLLSGEAHPGQPYASIEAPGASPLQPVVVTGYPAPEGFAESTFWSRIGQSRLLPDGGGIFGGSIGDTDPDAENPAATALWRFDANGEISQLLPNEVTIALNGIPRTFGVPVIDGWQLVGDKGIVFPSSVPGTTRILYLPFESQSN